MARNTLSPAYVQISYGASAGGRDHTMTFGVKPNVPDPQSGQTDLVTQNGTSIDFAEAMDTFAGLIADILPTSYAIGLAKIFNAVDPENPRLIGVYSIDVSGTVTGTPFTLPNRATFSYIAEDGSNGKIVVLGVQVAANLVYRPPLFGGATAIRNIGEYLINNTAGVVYSRSNSFPVFITSVITKLDDHWRGQILNI